MFLSSCSRRLPDCRFSLLRFRDPHLSVLSLLYQPRLFVNPRVPPRARDKKEELLRVVVRRAVKRAMFMQTVWRQRSRFIWHPAAFSNPSHLLRLEIHVAVRCLRLLTSACEPCSMSIAHGFLRTPVWNRKVGCTGGTEKLLPVPGSTYDTQPLGVRLVANKRPFVRSK